MLNPIDVVMALRRCNTVAECARELGVSRNTVYRYKKDPAIKELLATIASTSMSQISTELAVKHEQYVALLEKLSSDETVPPSVRVDALKVLFGVSKDALQMQLIDQRLETIERQLGAK